MMKMIIDYLRLLVSDCYFYLGTDSSTDIKKLLKDGYLVLPSLNEKICDVARAEVQSLDRHSGATVQEFSNAGDTRFFGTESLSHCKNCANISAQNSQYLPARMRYLMARARIQMANILDSGKKLGKSGSGDGWHCDTPFSHQLKIFSYLESVTSENGPLRVVLGSNTSSERVKIHKLLKLPISTSRYSDDEIDMLQELGYRLKEFTVDKGTRILVDTRMIHSGKPITSGHRFVLTEYLFKNQSEKAQILERLRNE